MGVVHARVKYAHRADLFSLARVRLCLWTLPGGARVLFISSSTTAGRDIS